jgi:hypothetical protein
LGYERKITENKRPIAAADNAPANSTHLIVYQTTFYNMGELGSMDIIDGPTKPRIASKNNCCTEINTYNYILFLDASNNIVEGRWKNNFYPDVIWFGNGRGDDQNHANGVDPNTGKEFRGNPFMPFDKIIELVNKSAQ